MPVPTSSTSTHSLSPLSLTPTSHPGCLQINQTHVTFSPSTPSLSIPLSTVHLHALSTHPDNGPPCVFLQAGPQFNETRFYGQIPLLERVYKALCDGIERNTEHVEDHQPQSLSAPIIDRLDQILTVDDHLNQHQHFADKG